MHSAVCTCEGTLLHLQALPVSRPLGWIHAINIVNQLCYYLYFKQLNREQRVYFGLSLAHDRSLSTAVDADSESVI